MIAENNTDLLIRNKSSKGVQSLKVTANDIAVYEDPVSCFSDVFWGRIKVPENGLYSLTTNVTVVRILKAERESARIRKTVRLQNKNDR